MDAAVAETKHAWRLPSIPHVALDKTDLRILSILQQNCRINLSRMARYLKCSKVGLHYRIQRMEREGVIRGYKTHFRLFIAPFIYHLFFVEYAGKQSIAKCMHALCAREDVIAVMSLFGEKNLMIACVHPCEEDFSAFKEWLEEQCGKSVEESLKGISFSNMELDYSGLYESISSLGVHKDSSFLTAFNSKKSNHVELKPFDFELMHVLQNDAQITLTTLAEKMGKSKPVLRKRLDELIRAGIIAKFSASVTPYAFPGTIFSVLRVRARSKKQIPELKQRFMRLRNGNGVAETQGKWDLLVFLHFADVNVLTQFRENLSTHFPEGERFQLDIIHEQAKLEWITPAMVRAVQG